MIAEAAMKGAAAGQGHGSVNPATKPAAPAHRATNAEARNLSSALLTSEFHSA